MLDGHCFHGFAIVQRKADDVARGKSLILRNFNHPLMLHRAYPPYGCTHYGFWWEWVDLNH